MNEPGASSTLSMVCKCIIVEVGEAKKQRK